VVYWQQSSHAFGKHAFQLVLLAGGMVVAAVAALAVVFGSELVTDPTAPAAIVTIRPHTPPAAEVVEKELVGVINAHSITIGSTARIAHASCVAGGDGTYACSYVQIVPPKTGACALAVLEWTPNTTSTYTVKTAGRVPLPPEECRPVTKVLHVLGTSG
jgi:hypothetical protein